MVVPTAMGIGLRSQNTVKLSQLRRQLLEIPRIGEEWKHLVEGPRQPLLARVG